MVNFEPTVTGSHKHIGCLIWFSVNCVKFVLLCSSSAKKVTKINLFCFFGPYIATRKKGGNIGSHPKPKSTFFGGNKKTNHKLSKAFNFIKISSVKDEIGHFYSR